MESRQVLDKGSVHLHEVLGSDLTVANAARVSFNKKAETMRPNDEKLIKFLAEHGHLSPFRHCTLQFEISAPLLVCRQHWKYIVGSNFIDAWNEMSKRYVTEDNVFYIPQPDEWRAAPENKKQGSGEPVDEMLGKAFTVALMEVIDKGENLYKWALTSGVCAEQARLFLPAYGLYVRYYWTASLQSVCHFLKQRLADDAQKEIQAYAHAIKELTIQHFPISVEALVA